MTRRPSATAWLDTGLPTACPCQWGPTGHCHQGRHDACGAHVVETPETDVWTTALVPVAPVWLADRVCRWRCPCECHTALPEPEQPEPKPSRAPTRPVQVALF